MTKLITLLVILSISPIALAGPLFESEKALALTLSAPFSKISRERDKKKHYPARLLWGDSREIAIELQVRGNNRLKKSTCRYPPLKVHFKKKVVEDSIFSGQSDLKLVVACKKRYSQYVRMEFLIYKMFASLSNNSFKVRWLELTFIDGKRERQSPGFFIEQKKRMGNRLGLTQVHQNRVSMALLDQHSAVIVDLFQFMIGNTDYSNFQASGTKDCCHNIKLMRKTNDDSNSYIPVPYDFDNAGLINAQYAVPSAAVPIRSVKTRIYRGLCRFNPSVPAVAGLFLRK